MSFPGAFPSDIDIPRAQRPRNDASRAVEGEIEDELVAGVLDKSVLVG